MTNYLSYEMQIFNQSLALTLFTCDAHLVAGLGKDHVTVDVPLPGGKDLILSDGGTTTVGGDIKKVDIAISNGWLTVTLHVIGI